MLGKNMARLLLAATVLASALLAQASTIDVFNMGGTISGGTWTGLASLQFVTVGDPGNVADMTVMATDGTSGYGSVPYVYQMGKYDVTTAQYTAFLNAVATTSDPYGLYGSNMATDFPNVGPANIGISRSGVSGSYTYSAMGNGNMPVFDVSWGDAARFCNWLQNGQPTAPEGSGTTEMGAYTLDGGTSQSQLMAVTRSSTAIYVIPAENEWYKAGYYVGGATNARYWTYPTQSNNQPSNVLSATGTNNANCYNGAFTDPPNYLTPVGYFAGSPGPYGTFDMGGDVWQWNETPVAYMQRGVRGGSFNGIDMGVLASSARGDNYPTNEAISRGFRVASVPEPGSLALLLAGALALGIWRLRRKV